MKPFLALFLFLVVPLRAQVNLPPLAEELRSLNEKPDPGFEDARLVIQALSATAASKTGADKNAIEELISQIKHPFVHEAQWVRLCNGAPALRAAVDAAKKKIQSLETNPPRRVGGAVDTGMKDMLMQGANQSLIAAEKNLAEIQFGAAKLAAQLATTNSTAADYLRAGRQDIALALASSMYAVAERHRLELGFTPALSYEWVKMTKLSPVQRAVEQDRASKLLVGHVALHEGAKALGSMSVDALYDSAKSGDLAGSVISFVLLQEGMEQQKKHDRMVDSCLEVLFFQPEPGDYPAKMRLVLNKVLEPVTATPPAQRFTENVVRDAIAAVDARLATPEFTKLFATVLTTGLQQAMAK